MFRPFLEQTLQIFESPGAGGYLAGGAGFP
jgi:hypothetical protein